MAQSTSTKKARLAQAHDRRQPVEVRLKTPWKDSSAGFVVALAKKWVVVHVLRDGFYLDDLTLLRLDQIKKVGKVDPGAGEDFVTRVVASIGVPVEQIAVADDATPTEVFDVLRRRAELVSLFHETSGYRWTEVGVILVVERERITFHAIDGDGVWAEGAGWRRIDNILRVDTGGRYLKAYERFGEPRPERP